MKFLSSDIKKVGAEPEFGGRKFDVLPRGPGLGLEKIPKNRWRNRRSATSFRYEILWEVPNFWVGFFLVSKGYGRICYQIPHLPIELENFFLIRGPSSLNKNISTTTDCTNRSCEFFRGVRGSIAGFFIHPRHFPILVEVCR